MSGNNIKTAAEMFCYNHIMLSIPYQSLLLLRDILFDNKQMPVKTKPPSASKSYCSLYE